MGKKRGIFITFEGVDGCGKSTQAKKLYHYLKKKGYRVSFIREPGGTATSEKIRRILLDRDNHVLPLAELLLYEAARSQLAGQIILPALEAGHVVICDRYYDSTTAYQGYGRGLDLNLIERLNREASFNRGPDLTFVIDVDYKTSLARRKRRPDRLEKEKKAFFNRVRSGFKDLARQRRCLLLDGKDSVDLLFERIRDTTLRLTARKKNRLVR